MEDPGGKLLPVHSAIASDSRGFLREPRELSPDTSSPLPLAVVESSARRFASRTLLRSLPLVVEVDDGVRWRQRRLDAEETAGVPVKGKT